MATHEIQVQAEKKFECWISENSLTPAIIAYACGVSEQVASEWIAKRKIPEKFTRYLDDLIRSKRKTITFVDGNQQDGLRFKLSLEDHEKLSRKAFESGYSLE
ncbi:MAG: hypothetical protein RR888_09840, partial [Akkermansia sp.]